VIAIIREREVIPNPKSHIAFQQGDLIGLIGSTEELAAAASLFHPAQA
jgi:K+/H+ antiporter YhaU regulatory subunit KhtT